MNENERCETCTFFDKMKMYSTGLCRRFAPTVGDPRHRGAVWPIVKESDWCGEYEQK